MPLLEKVIQRRVVIIKVNILTSIVYSQTPIKQPLHVFNSQLY